MIPGEPRSARRAPTRRGGGPRRAFDVGRRGTAPYRGRMVKWPYRHRRCAYGASSFRRLAERRHPSWFETMGTPLRSGRDFTAADRVGTPLWQS